MHLLSTTTPRPRLVPRDQIGHVIHPPATTLYRPAEEAHFVPLCSPDRLRIHTLGHFHVHLPGSGSADAEPHWVTPQSVQVLKCLVAAPSQQLTHDELMERLWPDHSPDHARRRLHDAVSKLRRALEPHGPAYGRSSYILTDRQSLRLDVCRQDGDRAQVWLDVSAFEQHTEAAITGLSLDMPSWRDLAQAALALYRGPFLPLDRYADWSEAPRQRYHRLWTNLVRRLVSTAVAEQHLDRAVHLVDTLTEAAPDDEDAVFLAMAVYASAGRRAEALRMFQQLRIHLLTSFGCGPNSELQALSETIRSGARMEDTLARLT